MVAAALIGAGAQIVGGILGNRSAKKAAAQQRAWALEDQKMQWVRHREASELGGFNPLATLGMGQGVAATPVSSNNYMGEAIATSGLMLADSLAKTQAAASGRKVEDLNRQRDILTRKLAQATLRPTVPGVFDRARNFGTGGSNDFRAPASMGASSYFGLPVVTGDEPVTPKQRALVENVVSDGASTDVVTGPDPEEYISGLWLEAVNRGKARARFENTDEARAGLSQRFAPAPKPKGPRQQTWAEAAFQGMLPPVFWNMAR